MRPREDSRSQLSAPFGVLPRKLDLRDEALAERSQRGDRLAFAALAERYQTVLYNLSLRMLDDPDDARDATQAALVKAFFSIKSFDPSRSFYSWLYRIGMNECFNHLRRTKGRTELDETQHVDRSQPAEEFAREELRVIVREALRQLPEAERTVVILRHYLDRSYREIAEILQLPETTVKSRLYEARRRLATMLLPAAEGRS